MKKTDTRPVVCIFCSSSSDVAQVIKAEGAAFAATLAVRGYALLYGGTTCGLMKVVADAHKSSGGQLVGVIPQYMIDKGIQHPDLDTTYSVSDLGARKDIMIEKSDCIVALPGGIGTYDEFFAALTLKQLKRHEKPMFVLNTQNYYDPMLAMIEQGIKHNTINAEHLSLFKVASTPQELADLIDASFGSV